MEVKFTPRCSGLRNSFHCGCIFGIWQLVWYAWQVGIRSPPNKKIMSRVLLLDSRSLICLWHVGMRPHPKKSQVEGATYCFFFSGLARWHAPPSKEKSGGGCDLLLFFNGVARWHAPPSKEKSVGGCDLLRFFSMAWHDGMRPHPKKSQVEGATYCVFSGALLDVFWWLGTVACWLAWHVDCLIGFASTSSKYR